MGLRFEGIPFGLCIFVGTICDAAEKSGISTEVVDSVDLRFLERVGAMLMIYIEILLELVGRFLGRFGCLIFGFEDQTRLCFVL